MKKRALTANEVKYLVPGPKRIEVPAGPPIGLYCVVQPSGVKSWALRYRWLGHTRKLTLGGYEEFDLAQARARAKLKLDVLEEGHDPAVVQAEEKRQEQPNEAKPVAEEWLKRAVKQTRTHDEVKRILTKEVFPDWKGRLITDIDRPSVLRTIDAIVDRDAPILANRALSILKRFFRWAEERGYVASSPIAGVRPPSKETTRDRVLKTEELTEIWAAADSLGYPFGPWIRFLILTAQRRTEVATMRRRHIDKAMWTLPREATKAGRVHDVPLSNESLEVLQSVPKFTKGDYLFTTTSGEHPISGYSKAKIAIDKAISAARKKKDPKAKPIARWTYHDLRRTAATWMAQNGVPPHVLAAILNHTPGSTQGVTSIYNRFRYTEERRQALQAWADFVVALIDKRGRKATA